MIDALKYCFVLILWMLTWMVPETFAKDSFKEQLLNYQQENYQEFVYLHLDKNHYFAGDFVRFKVYCLEKSTSKPSQLSKVAYVEFLDNDNNPVAQARIKLDGGSGFGELYLPTSISSNNYVVRAYTRWMRNFGAESFYHTATTIINPFRKLGLDKKPESASASLDFFPESGVLLDQIESKVVFQGKDGNGYPINFQARLMGNDSVEVLRFSPLKNGLGSFSFTPEKKVDYHVELYHSNGDTTIHPFTKVDSSGVMFSINQQEHTAELLINDSEISDTLDLVELFVMQNGKLLDQKQLFDFKAKHTFSLDLDAMQPGVARIYLIGNGNPLRTRAIYQSGEPRQSVLELEKKSFGSREEVLGALSSLNDLDKYDISFSVSNYRPELDHGQADLKNSSKIQHHLKYVHDLVSYYDKDINLEEELISDLLIAYPKTYHEKNSEQYLPEYRSPLVTGKIYDKSTKAPQYSIGAYLTVPGKYLQFYATKSISDGTLVFETNSLYATNEIVVLTDHTKDSVYSLEIDDPFAQDFVAIELPVLDIDASMEKWITKQSQYMQVQNANLKYLPKPSLYTQIDSSKFYQQPTKVYHLDDYTRFVVMEEVFREYIAGVNVKKSKDGFHFMVIDPENNVIFNSDPLLLLDGIPIFDTDIIMAIDPLKIEKIETVNSRFGKGVLDCQGVVSLTTYTGNFDGYKLPPDAILQSYESVQLQKNYSFQSYHSTKELNSPAPDFRSTLYWQPKSPAGTSVVEFFTGDVSGQFQLTVHGLDENGSIFSDKLVFSVHSGEIH